LIWKPYWLRGVRLPTTRNSTIPVFTVCWGRAFVHRMSKQFEIGADLLAGIGQTYYRGLDETGHLRGDQFFTALPGAKLALNVSYNMSLEFHPHLKYTRSFNVLNEGGVAYLRRFDGFSFGMSFSGNYRIGDDPDAPQVEVRSIRFQDTRVRPLFAAMQSFYVKNPVGSVTVTNTEKFPATNVEVSFFQNGCMDGPPKR